MLVPDVARPHRRRVCGLLVAAWRLCRHLLRPCVCRVNTVESQWLYENLEDYLDRLCSRGVSGFPPGRPASSSYSLKHSRSGRLETLDCPVM